MNRRTFFKLLTLIPLVNKIPAVQRWYHVSVVKVSFRGLSLEPYDDDDGAFRDPYGRRFTEINYTVPVDPTPVIRITGTIEGVIKENA